MKKWSLNTRTFVLGLGLSIVAACASVERPQVAAWRDAVVAVREQSTVTFQTVNAVIRDSQLRRAAARSGLSEKDFAGGLDLESLQRWRAAFEAMASYAAMVDRLLGPELPERVGESVESTGKQLIATSGLMQGEQGGAVSKAIGGIGKKLVEHLARAKAGELMMATDADVQALVSALAAILEPPESVNLEAGVLATVMATWSDRLEEVNVAFLGEGDPAKKSSHVARYGELLEQRDAIVRSVRNLRQSILDLGTAHTAAAQGRVATIAEVVSLARSHLAEVGEVLKQLRASRGQQP